MDKFIENNCTSNFQGDILFPSVVNEENNSQMILYAYVDNQLAQNLFKYYVGLKINITSKFKKLNPLQVPLTLYETPEIAKYMTTKSNQQLIAFSINAGNADVYDEFNIGLRIKMKESNITVDTYKSKSVLWREKKTYNKFNYIEYTVRDKCIIHEIQLRDN